MVPLVRNLRIDETDPWESEGLSLLGVGLVWKEAGRKFLGDASVLWLVWGGVYYLGVCIIVKRIERNTLDLCILTPIIYTPIKKTVTQIKAYLRGSAGKFYDTGILYQRNLAL